MTALQGGYSYAHFIDGNTEVVTEQDTSPGSLALEGMDALNPCLTLPLIIKTRCRFQFL